MALRVGIDLVAVADVRDALDAHADRYLRRVFSASETSDCSSGAGPDPARLAARFAAKEATMKVLAPRPDQALPWRSVTVLRAPSGAPSLRLTGAAARLAAEADLGELSVSLTHDGGYAGAIVVGETGGRP